MSWFFCKPDCKSRLLAGQVSEVDLERLLVPLTHALDAVFVYILTCLLISERLEEALELSADEVNDFFLLDPLGEWTFRICVVVKSSNIIWIATWFSLAIWIIRTLHHAQLLLTDHSSFFVLFTGLVIIHKGSSLSPFTNYLRAFHLIQLSLCLASLNDVGFCLWCVVNALLFVCI